MKRHPRDDQNGQYLCVSTLINVEPERQKGRALLLLGVRGQPLGRRRLRLLAGAAHRPGGHRQLPGGGPPISLGKLAAGDLRHSLFLDDGLAVGLAWCSGGLGFAQMEIVRVGRSQAGERLESLTQ